ncbi:hypothetical protein JCM6882_005082 [Rhodosporidiobolus microsporus]
MPPRGVPSSSSVAFGGSAVQHWQGATPRSASRNAAQKYMDHHCFQDDGKVFCFCNTKPRIEAKRRVTKKESSPNLGREFWSCGHWVEGEGCGFFLWCDEAASMGRRYRTPPPPGAPPPAAAPPPTSPQKRPRPSTPPRPAAAAFSSTPRSASTVVTENFDDIDFDSLDAGLDDEIQDDYEEEPPTQYTSSSHPPSPSPSKKAKFTSFGGGSGSIGSEAPTTPTKPPAGAATRGGFAAIRDDPDSPFHAMQRNLFGPGSTPAPPSSTPGPSSSPSKPGADGDDGFSALSSALSALPSLMESAKKDRERVGRLLTAAKKKEEALRRQVEKGKEEAARMAGENERLKERIRMLEEENNELRTRAR